MSEAKIIYLVKLTADARKCIGVTPFSVHGETFAATHAATNYIRPGWEVAGSTVIREGCATATDELPDFRGWFSAGLEHSVDSEYITAWLLRRDMQAIPVELTGTTTPTRTWVKSRFAGWKTVDGIHRAVERSSERIAAIAASSGITTFDIIETHPAGTHSDYALIEERSQNGATAALVIEFGCDEDGPFATIDTLANHNASTAQLNREWRDQ